METVGNMYFNFISGCPIYSMSKATAWLHRVYHISNSNCQARNIHVKTLTHVLLLCLISKWHMQKMHVAGTIAPLQGPAFSPSMAFAAIAPGGLYLRDTRQAQFQL